MRGWGGCVEDVKGCVLVRVWVGMVRFVVLRVGCDGVDGRE